MEPRPSKKHYKDSVREQIEKIKNEANHLSRRVSHDKVLTDQQRAVAYSSWIYSAVRLFTSTHEKGRTLEEVQARFHLSRARAMQVLNFLESAGLVFKEKEFFKMGEQRTFLEQGSPHLLKHHANWRIKALQQGDQISEKELMFTSPVSVSKKDFEKLREKMAEFIKDFLATVKDSPAEDLACFNMDFFWIEK